MASVATITKLEENSYRFQLPIRHVDERVNDVQLTAMLARETVIDALGEVLTPELVLARLDAVDIGVEIQTSIVNRQF